MASRRWYLPLVLLTTLLMGSTFAVGKLGFADAPPLILAGLRFVLAGGSMVIILHVTHRPLPRGRVAWLKIALVGLLLTAGTTGPAFLSLRTISAGESALLLFTNPLLVVILARLFFGVRYRGRQWAGVVVGLGGVGITLASPITLNAGAGIVLVGSACWAISTLLIARWRIALDVWTLTAYQMLWGGVVLLFWGVLTEPLAVRLSGTLLVIVLWLAFMGSVVQFTIWFFLLHEGDPGKTSAFLFLAPLFGALFGWLLLGQPIGAHVAGGGLLILASIVLVQWPDRSTSDPGVSRAVGSETLR